MTDHLIVIIYAIFNLWDLWGFLENWAIFWWRHFRSRWRHHSQVFNGSQDLGFIFQRQKILSGLDQPAACWISYKTLYFSDFNLWKNPHFKKKSTNQTSFSTKSTTLNPMVKSDLVTYGGGTIRFLFLSVTNMAKFYLLICKFALYCSSRIANSNYVLHYVSVQSTFFAAS